MVTRGPSPPNYKTRKGQKISPYKYIVSFYIRLKNAYLICVRLKLTLMQKYNFLHSFAKLPWKLFQPIHTYNSDFKNY